MSQEPLSSEVPTSFSESILNVDAKPYFHTTGSQSFSQSISNLSTAVPKIIPLQLSKNWEETQPVSLPQLYVQSKYNTGKPITQAQPYPLFQPYPVASVNYLPNCQQNLQQLNQTRTIHHSDTMPKLCSTSTIMSQVDNQTPNGMEVTKCKPWS